MNLSTIFTNQSPLTIWGAALSTVLATIKVYEIYQGRFRIKITLASGNQEQIITIVNLSTKPLLLSNLQLYWVDAEKNRKYIEAGYEEGCNISVPPHSTKVIRFSEQYYFPLRNDRQLYIYLEIYGRRGITKCLTR